MSNQYEKADLAAFKEKLNEGGYKDRTGARRAVGKFQTWSKADKEKAHSLINARFPEDGQKAAKKTAAKAKAAPAKKAVKRTPVNKKAAAAAAKPKVDGRSREARAAKKASASNGSARTPVTNGRRQSTRPRATVGDSVQVTAPGDVISNMARVVGTIKEALESMRMSRELVKSDEAKAVIDKEIETSNKIMGKAVRVLDSDVVSPLSKDETKPRREPSNGRVRTIAEVTEGYEPTEEERRTQEAFNRAEPNRVPLPE